jgi:hypothetical protein
MVVYAAGSKTTTVPVWFGDAGIATVDVTAVEPVYGDVSVVYWLGTKNTTVPLSPAAFGVAIVVVDVVEPE